METLSMLATGVVLFAAIYGLSGMLVRSGVRNQEAGVSPTKNVPEH
jgi:hypothetical protein